MHFSNAFLADSAHGTLILTKTNSGPLWSSAREIRRTLERWQTKMFIHELMSLSGVSSVYAMEEAMMMGQSGLLFPSDRPKFCDRMARCGEPAVAKQLAHGGRKDSRTQRWFLRLLEIAPEAVEVLNLPIWRLLDPQPLAYAEWQELGFSHVKQAARYECEQSAWAVSIAVDDQWHESPCYVPCITDQPAGCGLTSLLLGLRRWELQGDLLAYDLYFQELLSVLNKPSSHFSVQVLQPEIFEFVGQVFGSVLIPYGPENLTAQRERVKLARQAWTQRVLVSESRFDGQN